MARNVWLSTARDRFSFSFMVLGIAFVIYWDVTVVTPAYFPHICRESIIHFAAVAFLTANIAYNIYWVITEARKERRFECKSAATQDFHYCNECQQTYPPFSYHCRICNICSFKRDHHCVFTGTCINFHNILYFLKALWFLWIAAVYAVIYNFDYTIQNMGENVFPQLLFLICPPLAMMLGEVSLYGFLLIILELLAVIVMLLVLALIHIQLTAIARGQTRYERKHSIVPFKTNHGWRKNYEIVLGPWWYLLWLSPFVSLPMSTRFPNDSYPDEGDKIK